MTYVDKNEKQLQNGDVIDLHQTVNGQNLFVVFIIEPLDIRYAMDLNHKYEYDKESLLEACPFNGETSFEIIYNMKEIHL